MFYYYWLNGQYGRKAEESVVQARIETILKRHVSKLFYITKPCLYNLTLLNPTFILLNWGLQRYTLFFLFLLKNIDCGYSLEPPRRPTFAWSFLIEKLFHFLQYRILVESASDCMTGLTRHLNDWPTWIKENCVHLFRTYGSLGNTWTFSIFSLPLLIISPSLWLKHVHPGFITC